MPGVTQHQKRPSKALLVRGNFFELIFGNVAKMHDLGSDWMFLLKQSRKFLQICFKQVRLWRIEKADPLRTGLFRRRKSTK